MQTQQLFKQAQQLHQSKNFGEAERLYQRVVQAAPHFAEAKHLLGIVCSQLGKHEEGADWIQKAIQKQIGHPPYYNNLGLVYAKMKNWDKAVQAYKMATRFAPNFADAWFNFANALKAKKETERAIRLYQKAIKFNPKHVRAMYNLGNTLLKTGRPKSARKWFEKTIEIQPNHALAHNNMGSALDAWNEYDLAFEHYQKAVELQPNLEEAVKNLGRSHLKRGNYLEARKLIVQSIPENKKTGWEDLIAAGMSPVIFEKNEDINDYQNKLIDQLKIYQNKKLRLSHSSLHEKIVEPSANLNYQGRALLEIKANYGKVFAPYLSPKIYAQKESDASSDSLPHIGFVVTHGHEGVFMKCMIGLINQFDTQKFRVSIVCNLPHGEQIIQPKVTNSNVQFLGIPKEVNLAAETIANANFDALHYWEVGTDALNYFLPFLRLAPIQCATWGWPVTSGIPEMDYFLSCEYLETREADEHYTEELIRFKKLPTYYYRPNVPKRLEGIESYGLPADVPVYLCAQNLRKVHPDFDVLIKNILEKDENGIVVFINDSQSNVTQLLKHRLDNICGQNASRIHFLERMTPERYLNLVAISDVILDTLYYTGGANTAYDAIAAGTPYVTLPWKYHRGRYGLAAYRQIEVEDAIAKDEKDYVQKAVKIANDKIYRQKISEKILTNAHKVFEDTEAVRELENFFLEKINELK